MATDDKMLVAFAGSYDDTARARSDYAGLSKLHRQRVIGKFQGSVFERDCDGNVKVLDTVSTTRATGAKIGFAEGALIGLLYPPLLPLTALAGTGIGALAGDLSKGWTREQVEALATILDDCQAGVVVVAEVPKSGAQIALLPNADHTEARPVSEQFYVIFESGTAE